MKTRGDAMTSDAEAVLARMKTVGNSSFSRPNLSELIEPFTSRLEYFLKSVVFPSASRRATLHQLIEDLFGVGLGAQDVSSLHRLRELYNKSKHDPGSDLNWRDCVDALTGATTAMQALAGLGLPAVDSPFEKELSAVVYVGMWDHYVGGETEIGLFLPSDHWLGTHPISTFHMPMMAWDRLKPLLADHPRYLRGEQALGAQVWKSFAGEGDFLDAGVWQGDVRELLSLLSTFNDPALEKAVIPLLARGNDLFSIGIALVSATVDVVRTDPTLIGQELKDHILGRAKTEYAVEADTAHGRRILDGICGLVEGLSVNIRASLGGPAFQKAEIADQVDSGGLPVRLDGTTLIWLIR
jgi:hypothetical protein